MPSSVIHRYSDPYEFQEVTQAGEMRVSVTGRGEFRADLKQVKFDRLWMQRARLSLPSVTHSAIVRNRRMFFLQFDPDQAPIMHSGIEVLPSEIVCYPLGSDHHYRTSAPYHCGGLSLAEDDFAEFAQALLGYVPKAPDTVRVVRPPPALMSRLLKLHEAATDLAATVPEFLAHPEVVRAIEQEVGRALIFCTSDSATEARGSPGRYRLLVMHRFEEFVEAHRHEPLYLQDVCRGIGVSERTLRLHCHHQLGMGPHQYFWLRRMNLARQALAEAGPEATTVAAIANDHGFGELGRFAVQYRRLFGESPSATLRKLRHSP